MSFCESTFVWFLVEFIICCFRKELCYVKDKKEKGPVMPLRCVNRPLDFGQADLVVTWHEVAGLIPLSLFVRLVSGLCTAVLPHPRGHSHAGPSLPSTSDRFVLTLETCDEMNEQSQNYYLQLGGVTVSWWQAFIQSKLRGYAFWIWVHLNICSTIECSWKANVGSELQKNNYSG